MSDIIQLLPDSVANQIAAGEVIQRPASVIKELVENSVDAGATSINVVCVDSGRTTIQVVDNGKGMSETDARLSFERHATSKIRKADDLFNLHTMGFRGEALASIAAVSQVELRTRMADEEVGTLLTIAGSRFVSQEPCSCPVGSNFKIENLFFNVPARRKFLKSNTYLVGKKKVEEGLAKGLFFRKDDNSVWADLTDEGLDQKLLLRSDGTSVYMTQDIGTAEMRFNDFPIDKMIYVVGNEQNYHFQVLSILLDRLGFEWGKSLVHFSYGMVELPNGKMKSREGTVVDADDLIEGMIAQARQTMDEAKKNTDMSEEEKKEVARIVGLGALKYFLLKVDARKNMLFNPEESIDFNGNTGPFIQYTYARIRSILRKANDANISMPETLPTNVEISTKEEEIIQHIADFAAVVRQAGTEYQPAAVANYCYELVKEYNQFYHDFSILREEDKDKQIFRLVLSKNVAKVIRLGMGLLGIEMPERM